MPNRHASATPDPARPPRRGRLRRLREIVVVFARHGFTHFLERAHLLHYVPSLLRRNALTVLDGPDTIAERFAAALEELGPVFVKFGQILSTRPDLLADDFIAALERLQDQVPPQAAEVTAKTIADALGAPPERVFALFDAEPMACGSIAQAHRARLADGADVVVKVKRSGIDATVREDISLLGWIAELAEQYIPDLAPMQPRQLVREFSAALERELDFAVEAAAAEKFGELARGNPNLSIPRVHWDFVRRDVLVLDHAPGVKLSDPDWPNGPPGAKPFDPKRVADTLAHAFMRQYFSTGFFHADPHPGNIFIASDDRVALIDFGQTGRVPEAMRQKLALVLVALGRDDTDFAAELVADLGQADVPGASADFRAEFRAFVDRYFGMPAERLDFAEVVTGALGIARAHGLRLPRELVLMAKSLATVSGVVRRIDPEFRFDRAVRPYAKEVLGPRTVARGMARRWRHQAYRLLRLADQGPATIQELLDKTRRGQLRIVFQHEGLQARFAQAETAINRLSVGLIVAGITIGSAIVLAGGDGSRDLGSLPAGGVLGRPVPITVAIAGVGMTAAIMIGLWVIMGVLRTPRKPPPHDEWES